jgi:hypothetical protein
MARTFRPLGLVAALLAAGCNLDNPEPTREIVWADAETEELARRACYDCHSNETHWPWYSYAPVVGSFVAKDVHRARCHMNFSHWDRPNEDAYDAPEKILEKEMPLASYRAAHKEARLTDEERQRLAEGFLRTFQSDPPVDGGDPCEDDDDGVFDD